jgi:hypothetical protein
VLHAVLETIPDCAVRYPTLAEAKKQWEGMKKQHGPPPWDPDIILCLATDGTFSPAFNSGNAITQRLQKGVKGVGWNSVFVLSGDGCVSDGIYGHYGCYTDERISKAILKRHWDPRVNPHRLGMLLDGGWSSRAAFSGGGPGEPPLRMRPRREDDTGYGAGEEVKYRLQCSAKATVYRQFNEHGNGQLKRSYACIERPRRVQDRKRFIRDVEICVRLNNLRCVFVAVPCPPPPPAPTQPPQRPFPPHRRSRRVGWNQIRTTYLRHTDENVAEQLLLGRRVGSEGLLRHMRRLHKRQGPKSLKKAYYLKKK